MERTLEVISMIEWCGYKWSLPENGDDNCIIVDYPGVEPDNHKLIRTEGNPFRREVQPISGNAIRFINFDKNYVYLNSNIFGVTPHKIFMKEVLKFYLDNPYYF